MSPLFYFDFGPIGSPAISKRPLKRQGWFFATEHELLKAHGSRPPCARLLLRGSSPEGDI
jgi:hypothetical protein